MIVENALIDCRGDDAERRTLAFCMESGLTLAVNTHVSIPVRHGHIYRIERRLGSTDCVATEYVRPFGADS